MKVSWSDMQGKVARVMKGQPIWIGDRGVDVPEARERNLTLTVLLHLAGVRPRSAAFSVMQPAFSPSGA